MGEAVGEVVARSLAVLFDQACRFVRVARCNGFGDRFVLIPEALALLRLQQDSCPIRLGRR